MYALVTGNTQWHECTNGTIPNLPQGTTTAGKSIWFKCECDLSLISVMPKVSIEVLIK